MPRGGKETFAVSAAVTLAAMGMRREGWGMAGGGVSHFLPQ